MRAASVKSLTTIKDVTPSDARAIRAVWFDGYLSRRVKRERIDALIRTFGVEYLGEHKRSREDVYYCNAGDTYAGTILFIGERLAVGCWGDLMETNSVRERESAF